MTTMVRFYGPFVLYSRTLLTDICATQKGIHEEMLVSLLHPSPAASAPHESTTQAACASQTSM